MSGPVCLYDRLEEGMMNWSWGVFLAYRMDHGRCDVSEYEWNISSDLFSGVK